MAAELKMQLTREQIAILEAGRTRITPACAMFLAGVFLALICAVPLAQLAAELSEPGLPHSLSLGHSLAAAAQAQPAGSAGCLQSFLAANRRLLREMHAWETALEENAIVSRAIRPPIQYLLARWLGAGNEQAYCGRGDWLFFRPDVDYLTAPGFLEPAVMQRRAAAGKEWQTPPKPDPRPAILDFQRQLAARGIQLVLMPTPVKPMIHPDRLAPAGAGAPLQNPSYRRLAADLEAAGLTVFDPASMLASDFHGAGREAFLATDTHWRPEAMERTAEDLAQFITTRGWLTAAPPTACTTHAMTVEQPGDTAAMLRLPAWQDFYQPEAVEIRQVRDAAGNDWRPAQDADVLVLGDSFCNIYSLEAMGWGEAAGLVEHLSRALARPVDRILVNDNGAFAARAALARELARGRDRLAGKRLVIWQFAARELAAGDWRLTDLRLGAPAAAGFLHLPAGAMLKTRGVVAAIAPAPRPGSVPYADHIIGLHLVDLQANGGGAQALAYAWSMRDNVWTPAARLRPGETVEALLRPWPDVAGKFDGINRTELDDPELLLQEPCWAAEIAGLGFIPPE